MLPDVDGFEVCLQLRKTPATHDTRSFILSALSGEKKRRAGANAGADEYLTKPFDRISSSERESPREPSRSSS